jgi:hypothetical protein
MSRAAAPKQAPPLAARTAEEVRSAVASVAEAVEPPSRPMVPVVARAAAALVAVATMLRVPPPWPRAGRCHLALTRTTWPSRRPMKRQGVVAASSS